MFACIRDLTEVLRFFDWRFYDSKVKILVILLISKKKAEPLKLEGFFSF